MCEDECASSWVATALMMMMEDTMEEELEEAMQMRRAWPLAARRASHMAAPTLEEFKDAFCAQEGDDYCITTMMSMISGDDDSEETDEDYVLTEEDFDVRAPADALPSSS